MSKQEEMGQAPAELLSNVTWRRNQIVTESATLSALHNLIFLPFKKDTVLL